SRGALCATGQASILGLYDSLRLTQPLLKGQRKSWSEIDNLLRGEFERIRQEKLPLRYLSGTILSPTKRWMIERFVSFFPNATHIEYSPDSHSAILDAHEQNFGRRVFPRLRFDRAKVIAAFEADFLGTWISPVEFARGWAERRSPAGQRPE